MSIDFISIYVDVSDRRNVGFAYRITWEDGCDESGPLDGDVNDDGAMQAEFDALLAAHDVDPDSGRVEHFDMEGGGIRWMRN